MGEKTESVDYKCFAMQILHYCYMYSMGDYSCGIQYKDLEVLVRRHKDTNLCSLHKDTDYVVHGVL